MFYILFTQPLLNALAFFIWLSPGHDLGVAIIALTVAVRAALYPFQRLSNRSQEAMARLAPQINEIKKRFAKEKEKQLQATMALYRAEGVNPLLMTGGGLLLLVIQLPILITLFRIFSHNIVADIAGGLYTFTPRIGEISTRAFGLVDLARPHIAFALAAAAAQFFQMRLATRKLASAQTAGGFASSFQKQSQILFPLLTLFIAFRLPAAMALYWFVFSLLGLADDLWRMSRLKKPLAPPA